MASTSVQKTERLRIARTHALKEAEERYHNELMSDEERMIVIDRIRRLRRAEERTGG